MRTHRSTMTGFFTIAVALGGMVLPAALLAVEGESQLSGQLTKIEGDRYTVHGDQGKDVTVRVTKDTNIICATGKGNKMSTGQESGKEHQEMGRS